MRNSHLLLCGRIGGLNLIVSRYVVILRQLGRRDLKCCVWQTTQRCISPNGSICVSFSFAVKLNTAQSKLGVLKSNVHKRHLCSCARALPFSTVNTKMPSRSCCYLSQPYFPINIKLSHHSSTQLDDPQSDKINGHV